MIFSFDKLLLVAAIVSAGSVVQGAVGFASGMICLPLLVISGLSLPEAVTINVVSTSVQNIIGAWRLRPNLELRELALPVTLRWLGVPIGAFGLSLVDDLDPQRAKQLVGALLLAVVMLLGGLRVKPRERLNRGWQTLAFLTSGAMLGFAAIGGAPMVVYVNALTWSANKSRAFLFFCSATGIPVVAGLLWWNFGAELAPAATTAVAALPAVLAGLWLGLALGARLNKRLFRRLTFALIALIAIGSIIGPMLAEG